MVWILCSVHCGLETKATRCLLVRGECKRSEQGRGCEPFPFILLRELEAEDLGSGVSWHCGPVVVSEEGELSALHLYPYTTWKARDQEK